MGKSNLILVLNAGSSSVKAALFKGGAEPKELLHFAISNVNEQSGAARLKIDDEAGARIVDETLVTGFSHQDCVRLILAKINDLGFEHIDAVGHRIVHGGTVFAKPIILDADNLIALKGLIKLAPQHQPHNLAAIEYLFEAMPDLPQIGCFDTGFHHSLNPLSQLMALPKEIRDKGIKRYGFHGLSYEYINGQIGKVSGKNYQKIIVAHMGNGVSLCAIKNHKSFATSMGFTALDGAIMGKRSGSIDPGVIFHLLENEAMSVQQVKHMFYNQSGLLGISGISNDMATLTASDDANAQLAVEAFCYSIVEQIGRFTANLGGLDAVIFTGGIGENSSLIRQKICEQLAWCGAAIDPVANQGDIDDKGHLQISAPQSKVALWVMKTNEELMIAQHVIETNVM